MPNPLHVLILEDNPDDAELMAHELRRADFDPDWRQVETEPDFLAHLDPALDLILADYTLPQFDALRALHRLQERGLDTPFLVVSGTIGEEVAVECMKQGAADYLLKDRLARLGPAVTHALQEKQLRDEKRRVEARSTAFAQLGQRLSAATTAEEAARIIVGVADDLLGWDACFLDLYSPEQDAVSPILRIDIIQGQRRDVSPGRAATLLSPTMRRVLKEGKLLLAPSEIPSSSDEFFFGDTSRPSESLLFVPIRHGERVVGIFSIQSYTPNAYNEDDLNTLQALADHCGGALERIQAEEKNFSLLRFQNEMLDTAAIWIDTLDTEGNVTFWNRAAERISGYPREEVLGHGKIWEWLYPDPDYRAQVVARAMEIIQQGERVENFETVIRRKEGEERVISWHSNHLRDEKGQIIGSIALGADVTEQVWAEEMLAQERNLLRTLIDHLPDAHIFVKDTESRFLTTNVTHLRTLGVETLEEVLGQTDFAFFPQELAEQYYADEQAVVRSGQPLLNREELVIDQAGVRKWFLTTKVPLRGPSGAVVGLVGLSRDITARRQAEQSLQQQLTRISLLNQITRAIAERQDLESICRVVLQRLEDHLPLDFSGILLFDPRTDTLIVAARGPKSQPLAAELGVSEGAVLPVEQTDLGPCLQGETVYTPDTAAANAPVPQRLAQRGIRSVVATPLAVGDKVFGVQVAARREVNGFTSAEGEFLRMLSEHVALAASQARLHQNLQQAYDELRQTQQAVLQQERLRALGQMASGIAHDINNTLSPVVGFPELLLAYEPNLSERTQQYLTAIKTAGEDLTHTVARLREFYRPRDEQDILLPTPLNRLVRQVIELTRPRWKDIPQERGVVVEMRTDLQEDLPPVMGLESDLREALTNLLFNAVDAMPQGGTITIRTSVECRVSSVESTAAESSPVTRHPSPVTLSVSDTGVGMDEETRQRCLDPFFSTKSERGTGLGLAMVYGTIQRHEGEIEIESALGQGTTMRLIFPLREAARAGVASPQATRPLSPLRILCIDDEPLLRMLMKEMLESDGHTVEVADGGKAGLEAFRSAQARGEPFEVVITDLGMPYMDGREVARTVKGELPTTPVILLTGWGMFMRAEGDLPAQVDRVLSKPPRINDLRQALAQVTQPPF